MIFELMSKGTIVRLPDDRTGLPERKEVHVMLLLPFNRYILGTPGIRRTDEWVLGKLGSEETKEVFLYDSRAVVLALGDNGKPCPVPRLNPRTEEEKRDFQAGAKRREMRNKIYKELYD